MAAAVALPGHEVIGILPPGELVQLGIVQAVPIVSVPWFDTRQTCKLAHDYLAGAIEGRFEEYHGCSGYAAGVCRGTGGAGLLCLIIETELKRSGVQIEHVLDAYPDTPEGNLR